MSRRGGAHGGAPLPWPDGKMKWRASYCGPIAFSPDGQNLVGPLHGEAMTVWDLRTGRLVRTLKDSVRAVRDRTGGDSGRLESVCSEPYGSSTMRLDAEGRVLTCQVEKGEGRWAVRQWDLSTGEVLREVELPYRTAFLVVQPALDGKHVVVAWGTDGESYDDFGTGGPRHIEWWDVTRGVMVWRSPYLEVGDGFRWLGFAFSDALEIILAPYMAGPLSSKDTIVLQAGTGRILGYRSYGSSVAVSPDGKYIAGEVRCPGEEMGRDWGGMQRVCVGVFDASSGGRVHGLQSQPIRVDLFLTVGEIRFSPDHKVVFFTTTEVGD